MGARAADGAVGWCAPRFAIAAIGLAAQGCLEPCWASFREYMYMWRCKREDERGVWVVSGGGTSENPRTEFSAEIARSIFHTPASDLWCRIRRSPAAAAPWEKPSTSNYACMGASSARIVRCVAIVEFRCLTLRTAAVGGPPGEPCAIRP